MIGNISITCKAPGTSPQRNHLNNHGNHMGLSAVTPHSPPQSTEEVTKALRGHMTCQGAPAGVAE